MQLHIARLCLDCNEIHDAETCPICGSKAFAYLSRWVPAPERRERPRPTSSPEADVYRELMAPEHSERPQRFLKRTVLGVATLGIAGWLWRQSRTRLSKETRPPD